MRLESAGRAKGGIQSALLRAGEFLADRGYVQGTKWAANVSLRGLGVSGLKVVFEVNTTGQLVTTANFADVVFG